MHSIESEVADNKQLVLNCQLESNANKNTAWLYFELSYEI